MYSIDRRKSELSNDLIAYFFIYYQLSHPQSALISRLFFSAKDIGSFVLMPMVEKKAWKSRSPRETEIGREQRKLIKVPSNFSIILPVTLLQFEPQQTR